MLWYDIMKLTSSILITAVIIIVVTAGFIYFKGFSTNEKKVPQKEPSSQVQENVPQKQPTGKQTLIESAGSAAAGPAAAVGPAAIARPKESPISPAVLINTFITTGPEEGEIIEETNKVTFEFEAEISPKGYKLPTASFFSLFFSEQSHTEERLFFETKIEGFDDDWKKTYSKKRTVNLGPGPKKYTFLVRARTKSAVDPTPALRTFRINNSPYFGKIKITYIRSKSSTYPSLITLSSWLKKGEKLNITNWRLRAYKKEITIPQGIEKYQSLVLPHDIFVKRGDKIFLIGGKSPLGRRKNFRLNKCFGYFLSSLNFFPWFSKNCPKPSLKEISHLNPYCQDFILRLSRCKIPDYSDNFKVRANLECKSFIRETFNYNSCFKKHSKDEDFLKSYWYIYTSPDVAHKLHDTLYLYDKNGLLVDKYLY